MERKCHAVVCAVLLTAVFATSCGDDPTRPDLVTIAGVVVNIDDGTLASGVRVKLLGTSYMDEVSTGTDGAYNLRVPRGSRILLQTDDPDGGPADAWFTLYNLDWPILTADRDLADWPIHACPKTQVPQRGSVAAWDNFLQNFDDANGNRYEPTSSAGSGGIIAMLFGEVNGGVLTWAESLSVASNSANFPIGYCNAANFYNIDLGPPDPSLGPDILYPGSRTVTDPGGSAFSWGSPASTASTLRLTITDAKPSRNLMFVPVDVPVAPGTITMVLVAAIDGVANRSVRELICAGGLRTCTP